MPTVAVNGTTLWYEVLGEGPTCLVMHGGLGLDHALCRPVVERLAGRLRLVWYDHRGNGRSGRPPLETLTMEQLADDADALAGRLGRSESTRLNSSHITISYAVFCLKKKK